MNSCKGSPEGWGIEGDVKIASGHGPAEVPGLLHIDYEGGERAIFLELNFPRRGKLSVHPKYPSREGSRSTIVVPVKI